MYVHLLDPDMFNDEEPYELQTFFRQAAHSLELEGYSVKETSGADGGLFITFTEDGAVRLAERVMALVHMHHGREHCPFRLTGQLLMDLCTFGKQNAVWEEL